MKTWSMLTLRREVWARWATTWKVSGRAFHPQIKLKSSMFQASYSSFGTCASIIYSYARCCPNWLSIRKRYTMGCWPRSTAKSWSGTPTCCAQAILLNSNRALNNSSRVRCQVKCLIMSKKTKNYWIYWSRTVSQSYASSKSASTNSTHITTFTMVSKNSVRPNATQMVALNFCRNFKPYSALKMTFTLI